MLRKTREENDLLGKRILRFCLAWKSVGYKIGNEIRRENRNVWDVI